METPSLGDLVTAFSAAAAAVGFLYDRYKAREAKEEEIDQLLKDSYNRIFEMLIENPGLNIHDRPLETEADRNGQELIYRMLVSHFETAYMRLADGRSKVMKEMWESWEDAIHEWIVRQNFRRALSKLLDGENLEYANYMLQKMHEYNNTAEPEVSFVGLSSLPAPYSRPAQPQRNT